MPSRRASSASASADSLLDGPFALAGVGGRHRLARAVARHFSELVFDVGAADDLATGPGQFLPAARFGVIEIDS
jgi:hypothetical protein